MLFLCWYICPFDFLRWNSSIYLSIYISTFVNTHCCFNNSCLAIICLYKKHSKIKSVQVKVYKGIIVTQNSKRPCCTSTFMMSAFFVTDHFENKFIIITIVLLLYYIIILPLSRPCQCLLGTIHILHSMPHWRLISTVLFKS